MSSTWSDPLSTSIFCVCVRAGKDQATLCICAITPNPLLFAFVITGFTQASEAHCSPSAVPEKCMNVPYRSLKNP